MLNDKQNNNEKIGEENKFPIDDPANMPMYSDMDVFSSPLYNDSPKNEEKEDDVYYPASKNRYYDNDEVNSGSNKNNYNHYNFKQQSSNDNLDNLDNLETVELEVRFNY